MAETIAYLNILHPDYGKLAARVAVSKLHKETSENFIDVIENLHHYTEDISKLDTLLRYLLSTHHLEIIQLLM